MPSMWVKVLKVGPWKILLPYYHDQLEPCEIHTLWCPIAELVATYDPNSTIMQTYGAVQPVRHNDRPTRLQTSASGPQRMMDG